MLSDKDFGYGLGLVHRKTTAHSWRKVEWNEDNSGQWERGLDCVWMSPYTAGCHLLILPHTTRQFYCTCRHHYVTLYDPIQFKVGIGSYESRTWV